MSFIFMRAAEKSGAEGAGGSSAWFPLNVFDRMSPELHHFFKFMKNIRGLTTAFKIKSMCRCCRARPHFFIDFILFTFYSSALFFSSSVQIFTP